MATRVSTLAGDLYLFRARSFKSVLHFSLAPTELGDWYTAHVELDHMRFMLYVTDDSVENCEMLWDASS